MENILEQLKAKIKCKISELNYFTWFAPIINAGINDGAMTFEVPNKFIADWIGDFYGDLIRKELFLLTQNAYRLAFEIRPDAPDASPPAFSGLPASAQNVHPLTAMRARTVDALNPKYSFDRFVVGSSNQFAHAACKAVASLPGGHYNPLYIYGGVGLGKTHLLHAVGIQILNEHPSYHIIYMSAEKFMNELIGALRCERMEEFRRKFRDRCDVLLIDDVQFIAGKEKTLDEFFHTFNALHDVQKQMVLTADRPPKDMHGITDRLRSRFECGLVADIQPPDLETRIAILQKKAEMNNLRCPNDVAMFLASTMRTNVRELEGSLIRINAFASLSGAKLTVELAREVLGTSVQQGDNIHSIEAIQKAVAGFYNINISDLKSPRRQKSLVHPRQIAMYLCKKHARSSFPEIGGKFGGKDHTTVMHACRKIERLLETDSRLQNDIQTLEKNLLH